jgi:hypothetical protein
MAAPTIPTREEPHTVAESKQDTEQQSEAREFASFLLDINKGQSHVELSEKLRDLITKVQETGKAGSLTYKVEVKPEAGTENLVIVTDQIAVKLPAGERRKSLFFVDAGNNLVRDNPQQHNLFGGGK